MAGDIKNLAGRITDTGYELAMLIGNLHAQVDDLVRLRREAGIEDEKTEPLAQALSTLESSAQVVISLANTNDEVLQKLREVIGD